MKNLNIVEWQKRITGLCDKGQVHLIFDENNIMGLSMSRKENGWFNPK